MRNLLAALAAAVALIVVPVPSANSDTPGCVSHAEYDNLIRYLSTGQVAGRFDTNGWYIGSGPDFWRRGYTPCWETTLDVVVWYDLNTGLSDRWDVR